MIAIVAEPYKARQLLPTAAIPDITFLSPKLIFTIGIKREWVHLASWKLLLALPTNLFHCHTFLYLHPMIIRSAIWPISMM
jgi:hypothetical protein